MFILAVSLQLFFHHQFNGPDFLKGISTSA